MTPEEMKMDIRFATWQALQFSLSQPDFIADIKRQINGFDAAERSAALEAERQMLRGFGISNEQIDQFFKQLTEE